MVNTGYTILIYIIIQQQKNWRYRRHGLNNVYFLQYILDMDSFVSPGTFI